MTMPELSRPWTVRRPCTSTMYVDQYIDHVHVPPCGGATTTLRARPRTLYHCPARVGGLPAFINRG